MRLVEIATLVVIALTFTQTTRSQDVTFVNDHLTAPDYWRPAQGAEPGVDSRGDFVLKIPVLTVPGRNGLDFSVVFNYRSGIRVRQASSWIGLGWSFDPGSIVRDVQSIAFRRNGVAEIHNVDFATRPHYQPDHYYVTLPGASFSMMRPTVGVTTFPPRGTAGDFFRTPWQPWRIEFNAEPLIVSSWTAEPLRTGVCKHGSFEAVDDVSQFVLTSDNGTRYVFDELTLGQYTGMYADLRDATQEHHVTTWHLTAILGPDYTDPGLQPDHHSTGSWVRFDYLQPRFGHDENAGGCGPNRSIFASSRSLRRITTPTHSADFHIEERARREHPTGWQTPLLPVALKRITLYRNVGVTERVPVRDIALVHDESIDNFETDRRGALVQTPAQRLALTEIEFASLDRRGAHREPGYEFSYLPTVGGALDGDWETDEFGFFNEYPDAYPLGTTAGSEINGPSSGNGQDVVDDGSSWSLKGILFPSGAWWTVAYENDAIATQLDPVTGRRLPSRASYRLTSTDDASAPVKYFEVPHDKTRQGGARVVGIRQYASGNGVPARDLEFSYGPGRISGVPQPWFDRLYQNSKKYRSQERTKVAVYYDWVLVRQADGTGTRTVYSTQQTHRAAEQIATVFFNNQDLSTVVYGNQDINWGLPLVSHDHKDGNDFRSRTAYQDLGSLPLSLAHPAAPLLWRYSNKLDSTLTISRKNTAGGGSGNVTVLNKMTYDVNGPYHKRTGIRLRQEESGDAILPRVTSWTYPFQLSHYSHLESANRLTEVVREDVAERLASGLAYQTATVTTWKPFDLVGDGPAQRMWKPFRRWVWNAEIGPSQPTFDCWIDDGCRPSSDWSVESEWASYDLYGNALEMRTGSSAPFRFNYGSETGGACGRVVPSLNYSRLVGVERAGMCWTAEYDDRLAMSRLEDPAGRATSYQHDAHGRLAAKRDREGRLLFQYSYDIVGSDPARPWYTAAVRETQFVDPLGFSDFASRDAWLINSDAAEFGIEKGGRVGLRLGQGRMFATSALSRPVGQGRMFARIAFMAEMASGGATPLYFEGAAASCAIRYDRDRDRFDLVYKDGEAPQTSAGELAPGVNSRLWVVVELTLGSQGTCIAQVYGQNNYRIDSAVETPPMSPGWAQRVGLSTSSDFAYFADFYVGEVLQQARFFDGLGRLLQTHRIADATIVHGIALDESGRVTRSWLPFAVLGSTGFVPDIQLKASAFFDGTTRPSAHGRPFTETRYSPEGLVANIIGPGQTRPTITITRGVARVAHAGPHIPGHAVGFTRTTDEDGHDEYVYADAMDRTVLSRKNVSARATGLPDAVPLQASISAPLVAKHIPFVSASVPSQVDFDWEHDSLDYEPVISHAVSYHFDVSVSGTGAAVVAVSENGSNVLTESITDEGRGVIKGTFVALAQMSYRVSVAVGVDQERESAASISGEVTFASEGMTLRPLDTRFVRDVHGQVVSVTRPRGVQSEEASAFTTSYAYDRLGRLVGRSEPEADGDADGQRTDEPARMSFADYRYRYDSSGRIRFQQSPEDRARRQFSYFKYEALGRLIEEGVYHGSTAFEVAPSDNGSFPDHDRSAVVTRIYDGLLLRSEETPENRYDYTYDESGNISTIVATLGELPAKTVNYARGLDGRVQSIAIQDEASDEFWHEWYTYDAHGRVVSVASGLPSSREAATVDARFLYDESDRILKIHYHQGSKQVSNYQYDVRGRLLSINDPLNSGSQAFAMRLGYEDRWLLPVGATTPRHSGMISWTAWRTASNSHKGSLVAYAYGYDELDRLKWADFMRAEDSIGTEWQDVAAFDVGVTSRGKAPILYDDDGNITRLRRRDASGRAARFRNEYDDESDVLLRAGGTNPSTLSYDLNGRLTNDSGAGYRIEYGPGGMPAEIEHVRGRTTYGYDGNGRRVRLTHESETRHYLRGEDGRVLAVYQDGLLLRLNIQGPTGPLGFATINEGTVRRFYHLKDHLGSVRATVSDSGQVVAFHDYYPFGQRMPRRSMTTFDMDANFTGAALDDDTNLLYFGARYYDPGLVRWNTVDPLADKHADWSPYMYSLANPVNLIDPDGRQIFYSQALVALRDPTDPLSTPRIPEMTETERAVDQLLLGFIPGASIVQDIDDARRGEWLAALGPVGETVKWLKGVAGIGGAVGLAHAGRKSSVVERGLRREDLGLRGSVLSLEGSLKVVDGTATAKVDMLVATIDNPFELIDNLSRTARANGASRLRIEAVIVNEQLRRVLENRYGLKQDGMWDYFEIEL